MNNSRKETRVKFTEAWFLYNWYLSTMAESSKAPQTSVPGTWDDEMQELEEYFEETGTTVPPVAELLTQIETLEAIKLPDDQVKGIPAGSPSKSQEQELEKLLAEETTTEPFKGKGKGKRPVLQIRAPEPEADDDYEESFASQQETAQLREDFDTMTEKFKRLEEQFDVLMKERKNLPDVINNIRADLNSQLTVFSDKLYSVLESQVSKKEIQSALATIEEIKTEHSDELKAASGYLAAEPKASSPIVTKGVSLKGKGKFKPIK